MRCPLRFFVALTVLLLSAHAAIAQYCASYYDGTKDCGIPTLQACEQSVRGVGGTCIPDDTAQLGAPIPGLFQRMVPLERRIEGAEPSQDYQRPRSPELDDVPPPPGN
jgi:hypothetical protein